MSTLDLVFMWVMIPMVLLIFAIGFVNYRRTRKWPQLWLTLSIMLLTANNSLGATSPGRYETLKLGLTVVAMLFMILSLRENLKDGKT